MIILIQFPSTKCSSGPGPLFDWRDVASEIESIGKWVIIRGGRGLNSITQNDTFRQCRMHL